MTFLFLFDLVSCLSNFTDDGKSSKNGNDECDGKSFSGDDDVDGVPLDGAALLKKVSKGKNNVQRRFACLNLTCLCLFERYTK